MEGTAARKRRIVVLASGSGSNLQALIDACGSGRIAGSVVHVVSDRAGAFALERAAIAGIASTYLPRHDGEPRPAYDARRGLAGLLAVLDDERFPARGPVGIGDHVGVAEVAGGRAEPRDGQSDADR